MKYFLAFTLAASLFACDQVDQGSKTAHGQAAASDSTQLTTIQWIDSSKNFGKINEGQVLDVAFRFKNVGDKPLVIRHVRASCGCTEPNWPKEPIAPGAEGSITAQFNSSGREGMNAKDLYVEANTKGEQNHVVHFDVEVLKKQADNK